MDELVTSYGSRFLIAAFGVGLALLCLVAVLWLLRNRAPAIAPFMRPARVRQPRLQVLDAAPVDARRRLILIRRDDIEHLIMIGGPTDIVIESRIGEIAEAAAKATEPRQRIAPSQRALPIESYIEDDDEEPPTPVPARPAAARAARQPAPQPALRETQPSRTRPSSPPARAPVPQAEPEEEATGAYMYDEFFEGEEDDEGVLAEMLEASRRNAPEREMPAQSQSPSRREAAAGQPSARQARASESQSGGNVSASDFERVLEEEIAAHLSTAPRPVPPQRLSAPAAPASPRVAPSRPMAPPLTGRNGDTAATHPEERRSSSQPGASRPLPPSLTRPVATAAQQQPRPVPQPAPRQAAGAGAEAGRGATPTTRPPGQPNLQREIARIFGEISTKRGQ